MNEYGDDLKKKRISVVVFFLEDNSPPILVLHCSGWEGMR